MHSGVRLALFALTLAVSAARCETEIWSDDFDDGLGDNRWFADAGTWQMGSPTVGPQTNSLGARAFSGTNCATKGLNGNYLEGQNTRLIRIASFTVPATNQYPRLRFWHWYSLSSNDGGVVEVKPVGSNTWTAISATYTGPGGGVWTRPSLDLSAYAGQTIQVAFHFISDNDAFVNVSTGWYVDDVALVTGTPVFNNPEGFELGLGDWLSDEGTWEIGRPTSGPGSAFAGTNCAATVLAGNYSEGVDSRLSSPIFTVPAAGSSPTLRFRGWHSFSSGDQGTVEIKPTNSNSWTVLATNSGVSGGWTYPSIDLTAFATQSVQVAFRFVSDNDAFVNVSTGWYVDDILVLNYVSPPNITQPPTNQAVGIESPVTFVVVATGVDPLSYQWQFNDSPISGATSSNYFLANTQLTNAGNYSVIVSNAGGMVSSPLAKLAVRPLPGSFIGEDVSDVGQPGSVIYTNGTFTVSGSGEDIEATADTFYFVHEPLEGDCQIVARIRSLQGAGAAREAGVMIRESLATGSKSAFLRVNANTNVVFRRRLATDVYTVDTAFTGTNCSWLRLMRKGNTLIGHCSTNGTDWNYVWFTTLNMSNRVEVGIAVTAHLYGSLATAYVDHIAAGSLTPLPGTWPLSGPRILLGGETWGAAEFQRVGGFKMLVGGVVGDYFTVRSSEDVNAPFSAWTVLGTITNQLGVVDVLDPPALTNSLRFYRVISQ